MNKSDFYYDLPKNLIAQHPLAERSASRLMVLGRKDGNISHKQFCDIKDMLNKGDCLVLNDTKVIPARLAGLREPGGGRAEVLLLSQLDDNRWEALTYPGNKLKPGVRVSFGGGRLHLTVESITDGGKRIVRFEYEGIFGEILDELGEMPLPPYIVEKIDDKSRYQTVYAKHEGSASAPTAGFHFTAGLLDELSEKGVLMAKVTLHIGLGTFRPVKEDNILNHKMHSEYCVIEKSQADIINGAKEKGGRIIAVGTTSVRTLESFNAGGKVLPAEGCTDIFIWPGYEFNIIDGLITNFHLPESTLIMLVSAFASRESVLNAYAEAIREKYRFFSFGDAMLII